MRQSEARVHDLVVLILVVARLVDLVFVIESGGGVVHERGRREDRFLPGDGGIDRRSEDKRFEDGARGPVRDGMIQLALAVVTSADEGEDLAGLGIQRHQSHLRFWAGPHNGLGLGVLAFADFDHAAPLAIDKFVDLFQSGGDGFRGCLLQVRIKRGIDAQTVFVELFFGVAAEQGVLDQVDEVGRVTGFDVGSSQFESYSLGLVGLGLADGAGLHHGMKHEVAPGEGGFLVAVRRQIVGPLDHPRQQGRLGQR